MLSHDSSRPRDFHAQSIDADRPRHADKLAPRSDWREMSKVWHEIRDPIHTFVRVDNEDRIVLGSRPFQRLREINQLSMSHLVYPGATHKRFEHSLGVMELAGRVYDVITQDHKIEQARPFFEELTSAEKIARWRRVVRMAALCHDIGHFPFSHVGEQVLPDGWDHERMTRALIQSDEMEEIWNEKLDAPMRSSEIADLAVGPDPESKEDFPPWKAILKEIITGDTFGVDRMDYLLRDSLHVGVAYGRFDHHRLVDTLRILPGSPTGAKADDDSAAPELGVERGGLESAEALVLARYFMYSQVYLHEIRRIYDLHLTEFLEAMLADRGGVFPTSIDEHLGMTDIQVMAEMHAAAADSSHPGHESARRILSREHFRRVYSPSPSDRLEATDPSQLVFDALNAEDEFKGSVRKDRYTKGGGKPEFPVLVDGKSESSTSLSAVLRQIPPASTDCVYVAPEKREKAEKWLEKNLKGILS
jgi:HD superfamily phosphohydrolase